MEPGDFETKDCISEADHGKHNAITNNEDHEKTLMAADNSDDDKADFECGIGAFRPACLQPCTNMYCFVFFYSFSGLATSTLSSYITSQITALERQFGFSSTETGFLLACNDIGFLATVLFVSYYLRNSHAPRFLSLLTFLFGISGLICALPYFLGSKSIQDQRNTMKHQLDDNDLATNSTSSHNFDYEYMCRIHTGRTQDPLGDKNADQGHSVRPWANTLALIILATGMVIQGAAKSGRSPLITSYVDNNVKKTRTGKFVGMITAVAILAPSVSFSSATIFSRLYFTLEKTDLTPEDPRWIGAWWLGFLVFGIAAIIFMFPVMLFPRKLAQKNGEKEEIKMETKFKEKSPEKKDEIKKVKNLSKLKNSFKGFFKSIIRILHRLPYVLLTASMSVKLIGVAGVFAFNAKYLEVQYFLPAWKSNALMGFIKLFALSGGTLIGGLITSKLKLSARGTLAMITIIHLITGTIDSLYLMAGCELPPIVGPDTVSVRTAAPDEFLKPKCVSTCSCDEHKFLPVCFNKTITYFSPCFAGCQGKNGSTYTGCTCLPDGSTVTTGFCDTGCNSLHYYIAIAIVNAFIGTMLITPSYIANLRIAGDEDKSLAVGMSTFFTSLIGWMSGPVIFGFLVDATCLVWNTTASGRGSCSLYDNRDLRNYMFITRTVLTFAAAVLTFSALLAQIREEKRQETTKELEITDKEFEADNKC